MEDSIEIPVQINGKLRCVIALPVDADQAEIERLVEENEKIAAQIDGKTIVKKIYVKNKLINYVVR